MAYEVSNACKPMKPVSRRTKVSGPTPAEHVHRRRVAQHVPGTLVENCESCRASHAACSSPQERRTHRHEVSVLTISAVAGPWAPGLGTWAFQQTTHVIEKNGAGGGNRTHTGS